MNVGAAIGINSVGDYHQGAPALCRTHFLIAELPDGVVERRLIAGLRDSLDRAVEQIKTICKVLTQGDLIIEGCEQCPILSCSDNGIDEVTRRLLLEFQFACSRRRGVH